MEPQPSSDTTSVKRNTKRVSAAISRYDFLESPVGRLLLAGADDVLMLINFPTGSQALRPRPEWVRDDAMFAQAKRQLRAYFDGTRTDFSMDVAMDGTDFQKDVWTALRQVPFGATVSYGELARRAGRPKASRAVGAANHANPLPIVVPCHRVIGSDNSLTGFGGGLETKLKLLALENPAAYGPSAQGDLFQIA